jgi:hypothetical protein
LITFFLANIPHGATHVISSGPIQINSDQLDNNLAAEIAQRVSNSVQRSYYMFIFLINLKICLFFLSIYRTFGSNG